MSSNLVIVAIPDENDRVWKVSSEKVPHMTLLFLGETDDVANLDQIIGFTEHAASTTLCRFHLPVDRRGELGADQADVLFFKKDRYDYKAVRDFRAALLQDHNIKTAYDSATQFDGVWQPHLTLGYPAAPAKEDGDDFPFYDVGFNKVAVWPDDFEGPEFLLEDYWDKYEALEAVPMDVSMSDIRMSELQHYGVKGMRWGVRREDLKGAAKTVGRAAGKAAKGAAKGADVVAFELTKDSDWVRNDIVNGASKKLKGDLPGIKANHGDYGKLRNRAKKPFSKEARAYRKDVKAAYLKRLEESANEITSISGSRRYTLAERGKPNTKKYYWSVSTEKNPAKHAADSGTRLVRPIFDDEGWIIDIETVEDEMAQTLALGEAFLEHCGLKSADPFELLEHYGVKGMRWGQRKTETVSVNGRTKMVTPKKAEKLEKKFAKKVGSAETFVKLHNQAADGINSEIGAFNKRFEDKYGKEKMDSGVLWNNNDPITKEYHKAYNEMFTRHLDKAAADMGTSPTGKLKVKIHTENMDSLTEFGWGPNVEKVKHADETDEETELVFVAKLDTQGRILSVKPFIPQEDSMAQSELDPYEQFMLAHYGVKGMRWGFRKERPTAVTPSASSRVPHGKKRKTKIKTEGGENQPASADALKVAEARAKLKRSGTAALSNQELREVANRLQLEAQVATLTSSRGQKFVMRELETGGRQLTKTGIKRGIPAAATSGAAKTAAKKVKKGAATAAVAALL